MWLSLVSTLLLAASPCDEAMLAPLDAILAKTASPAARSELAAMWLAESCAKLPAPFGEEMSRIAQADGASRSAVRARAFEALLRTRARRWAGLCHRPAVVASASLSNDPGGALFDACGWERVGLATREESSRALAPALMTLVFGILRDEAGLPSARARALARALGGLE